MAKKIIEVAIPKAESKVEVKEVKVEVSELDKLRALYQELKDRGVNSIGDLEVKIARLQ